MFTIADLSITLLSKSCNIFPKNKVCQYILLIQHISHEMTFDSKDPFKNVISCANNHHDVATSEVNSVLKYKYFNISRTEYDFPLIKKNS